MLQVSTSPLRASLARPRRHYILSLDIVYVRLPTPDEEENMDMYDPSIHRDTARSVHHVAIGLGINWGFLSDMARAVSNITHDEELKNDPDAALWS
jgi:hypothetical protein